MSNSSERDAAGNSLRPEVQRIIASGQISAAPREGRLRSCFALILTSCLLLYCSFTPLQLAPAAWLALTPLTICVRLRSLPRGTLRISCLLGFIWGICTLQWMRLGHPAMYGALAALAFWLALFFPCFLWSSRRLVRVGCPVWLAVPLTWTALEYCRSFLLTGFAWYFLGHSQYLWPEMIQIADITGVYGVSFLLALVAAAIACQIPAARIRSWQLYCDQLPAAQMRRSAVTALACFTAVWGYGWFRLQQSTGAERGPVISLVQGNFNPELKQDPALALSRYRIHDALTESARSAQPDLIVWPETMFPWAERSVDDGVTDDEILAQLPLQLLRDAGSNRDLLVRPFRDREVQNALTAQSQSLGSALMIGLESVIAGKSGTRVYNSAAFVRPDLGYIGRYDKIHRVIFGEYLPLRNLLPWLDQLSPFGAGFGIEAGSDVRVFEYGRWAFAPLICFEDTVPPLIRRMAAQRTESGAAPDVLVNLTNDAWFRGSSELDQHLITACFRCVENRIPMVRAVNGGISSFIDGNGRIREPASIQKLQEPMEGILPSLETIASMTDTETGRWHRQFSGLLTAEVPLDERTAVYTSIGDVFARSVLAAIVLLLLISCRDRRTVQSPQAEH
jgi:apolipoprotein N-acyltransferase